MKTAKPSSARKCCTATAVTLWVALFTAALCLGLKIYDASYHARLAYTTEERAASMDQGKAALLWEACKSKLTATVSTDAATYQLCLEAEDTARRLTKSSIDERAAHAAVATFAKEMSPWQLWHAVCSGQRCDDYMHRIADAISVNFTMFAIGGALVIVSLMYCCIRPIVSLRKQQESHAHALLLANTQLHIAAALDAVFKGPSHTLGVDPAQPKADPTLKVE